VDISPNITQAFERQEQFVLLLRKLTDLRKIEWAQSEHEPGFVYCMVGDEYIAFEVRGGKKAEPVRPSEPVAGIVSHCRNVTYLWLEGLHGWNTLLELLRQAPIDHKKFIRCRQVTLDLPTKVLEKMIET
jgi:hypothetical protein